jgi:pseudouridine synthase
LDPEANHEKEYEVLVDKRVKGSVLKALENGVDIEGYTTKPARAIAHPKNDKKFTLILTEGKKHQVRRMCAALGYQVQALKRTRIANIELGKLKPNQFRKLQPDELHQLLTTLKLK